jgi:addiction module HigA family antidote
MINKMRPIHPGEILQEELIELGLSANSFAAQLHVPTNRITSILHKKRAITPDTALRLARYFGTTPTFWLNLQMAYDLKMAIQALGRQIEKEVQQRNQDVA